MYYDIPINITIDSNWENGWW